MLTSFEMTTVFCCALHLMLSPIFFCFFVQVLDVRGKSTSVLVIRANMEEHVLIL